MTKAKSYEFPVTVTGTVSDPLVFETNGLVGRWGDGDPCSLGLDYFVCMNEHLPNTYIITDSSEKLTGEQTPKASHQVLQASSVPPVTVKREVLTIDKIGVGQTFIVHGKPEEVYVKISNSHVFNHKRLQMHTTDAQRFMSHLNLVVVELHVFNGK